MQVTVKFYKMRDTLTLGFAIGFLLTLVIYGLVKAKSLSRGRQFSLLAAGVLVIAFILVNTRFEKVQSEISRFIRNSRPKTQDEVYSIIFKRAKDSCVTIVNFKDQEIPKVDCCVWMELKTCRRELDEILKSKKYEIASFPVNDRTKIFESFPDRPQWCCVSCQTTTLAYFVLLVQLCSAMIWTQ